MLLRFLGHLGCGQLPFLLSLLFFRSGSGGYHGHIELLVDLRHHQWAVSEVYAYECIVVDGW